MSSISHRSRRRAGSAVLAVAGLVFGASCQSATDALLQATDPDLINPSDIATPDGADALRVGTLGRLTTMTASAPANTEGVWFMGGLLTDEWKSGDTFVQRDETDKRTIQEDNSIVTAGYRYLHRARISANQAIAALKTYKPSPASGIGQMYFVSAYAHVLLGEDFCTGQPFADGSSGALEGGDVKTTAEVFQMAAAVADTGLTANGNATDATTVRVKNALLVTRARALMNLGGAANYAAAAALVAGVPTSFTYDATFLQISGDNGIWALNNNAKRYVVGDSVEGTARIFNASDCCWAKISRFTEEIARSSAR